MSDYDSDNRTEGNTKELRTIAKLISLRIIAKLNKDDELINLYDVELNFARRCEKYAEGEVANARDYGRDRQGEVDREVAPTLPEFDRSAVERERRRAPFNIKAREEILSIGDLDYSNQPSSKKNFERLLDEMQE